MATDQRLLLGGIGAVVAVAAVLSLTGGDGASDTAPGSTTVPPTANTTTTTTTAVPSTSTTPTTTTTLDLADIERSKLRHDADLRVASLDPVQLARSALVTGLDGTDLVGRLTGMAGTTCVGGVFVTESNGNWADPTDADGAATALTALRAAAADCDHPPLVTTDAELGSIVRVPVATRPSPAEWTRRYRTGSPYDTLLALQSEAGSLAADLRALGVDVNFGVVADVVTDPGRFMARGGRTFGDDPGDVAALANAVVNAECSAGIAPTLKHFPNQGDTPEDPHATISTAVGGADLWAGTGRLPYVDTAAPVVMVGHIVMPDLDPDLPASLSPTVLTTLLRDDLGYDGIVVTDDLSTMRGATAAIPDPGARAVAAISAGADLVLFVDDADAGPVIEALTAAAVATPSFHDRLRDAVGRVERLRLALEHPDLFELCPGPDDR